MNMLHVLQVNLDPNESVLLTTLTYAVAYALKLDPADDWKSKMDAIFIGLCEKYEAFKRLPNDVPYNEHEWAQDIINNALKYAAAVEKGAFSGSIMSLGETDDTDD